MSRANDKDIVRFQYNLDKNLYARGSIDFSKTSGMLIAKKPKKLIRS